VWLDFNSAIRFDTRLDGRTRELAIMLVAILNGVDYIVQAHGSSYALKEGLTREQVEALADWRASNAYDAGQRALLAYVEAMTRAVAVPDDVFAGVLEHYGEQQLVELTVLVGAYNFNGQVHLARDSTADDGYFEIHGVQNGTFMIGAAGEDRVVALMGQQVTVKDADVKDVIVELDADVQYAARERGAAWADRTKGGNAWFAKALQSQRDFEALWKDAPRYRNVKVKQA